MSWNSGKTDRLNDWEVEVGPPSPQWTTIWLRGEEIVHGLRETELMDLLVLIERAVKHIREVEPKETWGGR